jgi:hypothetical protein
LNLYNNQRAAPNTGSTIGRRWLSAY